MNSHHKSVRPRLAPLIAAMLLAGCASSRIHTEGMQLVAEGKHDAAIAKLREASQLDPGNSGYRIDLLRETQGLRARPDRDVATKRGAAAMPPKPPACTRRR